MKTAALLLTFKKKVPIVVVAGGDYQYGCSTCLGIASSAPHSLLRRKAREGSEPGRRRMQQHQLARREARGATVDEASRERNKRLIKRPAGTTPIPSIDRSRSPNCKFQCKTASMFIELKVAPTVVLRNLLKLSLEFNIHMVAIFCSSQSLKVHTICLKKLIILRGNNLFEHPLVGLICQVNTVRFS
jgi:hypothetical protein